MVLPTYPLLPSHFDQHDFPKTAQPQNFHTSPTSTSHPRSQRLKFASLSFVICNVGHSSGGVIKTPTGVDLCNIAHQSLRCYDYNRYLAQSHPKKDNGTDDRREDPAGRWLLGPCPLLVLLEWTCPEAPPALWSSGGGRYHRARASTPSTPALDPRL